MKLKVQQHPHYAITPLWNIGLILLVVLVSSVAVVVKGFHVFSESRNEPFIQGADDAHYFMWLRSWVVDGDISFANDVAETPYLERSAKETILSQPLTETGLVINKFPVGWAVLSLPFYLIAHWIAPLTPWPADGFSPPYQIAIWLGQILIAGYGFYLLSRILRRWFSIDICIAAIALTWLNSPMVYYQSARISMVHNVVFVLACLVWWFAIKIKEHFENGEIEGQAVCNRLLLLMTFGASFHAGLLVICRPSSLVYLILPISMILAAMIRYNRNPSLFLWMVTAAISGAFLGAFPQLLAWKHLYGQWIYYSYQGEGFHWFSPQILASLFSPHHGWFNWHPVLLIGLLALIIASIRGKFPKSWMVTGLLIIWINASWHMFYFGSAFGGRAYEFMGCFATLGIAFILKTLDAWPKWRTSLLVTLTIAGIWNGLFLYAFMQGLVHRELPVTWLEKLDAVIRIF